MKGYRDFFRRLFWEGEAKFNSIRPAAGGRSPPVLLKDHSTRRSTTMVSLVQHSRKVGLAAFAVALVVGILSCSSAMAQHSGHGGGGGFAGIGHGTGFAHYNYNFGGVGGYGFYPGYYGAAYGGYDPSYGGYGLGSGFGNPYYGGYGTGYGFPSYGYGSGYGYGGSTFANFGFIAPALGFGD
jgi:hypothetical protein